MVRILILTSVLCLGSALFAQQSAVPPAAPALPPCPAAAQKAAPAPKGGMMQGGMMGAMPGMMMGRQMSPVQMRQMRTAMACIGQLTREMQAHLQHLSGANPAVRHQLELITHAFAQLAAMHHVMMMPPAPKPPQPAKPPAPHASPPGRKPHAGA